MKKFTLSVSEPCHENWSKMTPDERGRFCASCQKTVVDFTNMSNRQLAEYFKKPKGSVCGRFHNDQLDRPIEVPKKRVPWIRYFFQFTWPAFVLFLKSCGQRNETLGLLRVKENRTIKEAPVVMGGIMLPKITPVDTMKLEKPLLREVMGDVEVVSSIDSCAKVMGDTTMIPITNEKPTTAIDTAVASVTDMHCQDLTDTTLSGTLGIVSVAIFKKEEKPTLIKGPQIPSTEINKMDVLLYPNPIAQGQSLTVKVSGKWNGRCEVRTVSGQVLRAQEINLSDKQTVSIDIPYWPTGTYLLQLIDENNHNSAMQKFVVR